MFDFSPSIVFITSSVGLCDDGSTIGTTYMHFAIILKTGISGISVLGDTEIHSETFENDYSNFALKPTFNANIVSWYSINTQKQAVCQMNVKGVSYNYLSIG